jgi:hypothetical protein
MNFMVPTHTLKLVDPRIIHPKLLILLSDTIDKHKRGRGDTWTRKGIERYISLVIAINLRAKGPLFL